MWIKKDPELARRLRVKFTKLRAERGLTLEGMERLTGMASSSYHHLESGERMPTIPTLKKICEALRISSHEILGF